MNNTFIDNPNFWGFSRLKRKDTANQCAKVQKKVGFRAFFLFNLRKTIVL
jgi:hypothetical protein